MSLSEKKFFNKKIVTRDNEGSLLVKDVKEAVKELKARFFEHGREAQNNKFKLFEEYIEVKEDLSLGYRSAIRDCLNDLKEIFGEELI